MQVVSTRGVGQYIASEIHTIFYSRLDPLALNARTGIILAHGFAGTGDSFSSDSPTVGPFREMVDRLVMKGMPAIATDLGGLTTWGNETVVSRLNTTITYFNTIARARTDRVILLGLSMGGTSVLNWARNWNSTAGNDFANLSKVAAIALFAPAIDIEDIDDNDRGGFAGIVAASYSSYLPSGWASHRETANPANYAAGYSSVPIRIWYSGNDPICIPATQTAFAAGSGATLTNVGNVGHTMLGLDTQQVADWVSLYM